MEGGASSAESENSNVNATAECPFVNTDVAKQSRSNWLCKKGFK